MAQILIRIGDGNINEYKRRGLPEPRSNECSDASAKKAMELNPLRYWGKIIERDSNEMGPEAQPRNTYDGPTQIIDEVGRAEVE